MKDAKCTKCGGDKWEPHETYSFIRKCSNPICNGLHPYDISKLSDIEGILLNADINEIIDFKDLEECMKKNVQ